MPYTEKDPKLLTELLARVKVLIDRRVRGGLSWAALQGFRGKLTWNLKITKLKRKIISIKLPFIRFHVNFPGCTTEFMKRKWLLNKKECYTKLLFSGVWVVLLLDFLPVFHGSLDGQRKDMFRKLAPKYLPVLKRNIPRPTPKTNMTMENPPFEDVFPIENWDFPIVMLVFRGVNCTRHKICTSSFQHCRKNLCDKRLAGNL